MRIAIAFFIVLALLLLTTVLIYILMDDLSIIPAKPDSFSFSLLSIETGITAPLFLIVFVIISLHPIFKTEKAPPAFQTLFTKALYTPLIADTVMCIGIRFFYNKEFNSRGYIACPGMAIKHAKSSELCKKR